jgi:AcrR family transcriptional regulator
MSNEIEPSPVTSCPQKSDPEAGTRPYQLRKRQEAVDRNRERMIQAAIEVLREPEFVGFTMEAVARKAGVTRQTVHNQYGSRRALLEAVFSDSASRSVLMELPRAFQHEDPVAGLLEFVRLFVEFWSGAGVLTRRVRAMAALDPEFEATIAALDARRAGGTRHLVMRVRQREGAENVEGADDLEEGISAVWMLTSFECYDTLAKSGLGTEEIQSLVRRLTLAALRLLP